MENKETFSEVAAKYLREQIINGKMMPKERIVEQEIAKKLNISRGPVREALKTLMLEGLIDYETNKGCTVALLSPKDAYEVFYMRGSLEKIALEKCGGKLDDSGIFMMEDAVREMRRAMLEKNTAKIVAADEMFHKQIILSGHIDRLTKMWEILSPLNGAMFLVVENMKVLERESGIFHDENNIFMPNVDICSHHKLILDVLKEGALERSCKYVSYHYLNTGERIYKAFLKEETKSIFS